MVFTCSFGQISARNFRDIYVYFPV